MNRYILLIFLTSWSSVVPLSRQCETGIAHPGHYLSISHSLMANADVALLKTYQAEDVNACMKDCCTEIYGSCTIVSFKRNVSENSCTHFNCRPVTKCRYLSSDTTDSFSFSSSPLPAVPFTHASKNDSSSYTTASTENKKEQHVINEQELGVTKETVATYSEEQFAMKNDNTTIKPRKGVEEFADDDRKGVKPRKGVTLDTASKIKPRKGVEEFVSETVLSTIVNELSSRIIYTSNIEHSSASKTINSYTDAVANDFVSALEKVFEDDLDVKNSKEATSTVIPSVKSIEITRTFTSPAVQSRTTTFSTQSSVENRYSPSTLQSSFSTIADLKPSVLTPNLQTSSAKHTETVTYSLPSSSSPSTHLKPSVLTPNLQTSSAKHTKTVTHSLPQSPRPSTFEQPELHFHEISIEDVTDLTEMEESEKERKYKSSMHLVLSLVFGLLVLFTVMGVVAKRVYDGWLRRHYRRMDFLIDGMYNAYE